MASVHKDPRGKSPYWYCAFYLPDGSRAFRSTKAKDRGAAMRICIGWENASMAGRAKRLTEVQTRRVLSDILETATGERPQFFTCREWLDEWVKNREGSATPATMLRYKQVTRDFLEHLGSRADLVLTAISPADVRSFRDALKCGGRAASTVNNVIKKVLNVPFATAARLGYLPTNPVAAVDSLRRSSAGTRKTLNGASVEKILFIAQGQTGKGRC